MESNTELVTSGNFEDLLLYTHLYVTYPILN